MEHVFKKFFSIALLFSSCVAFADSCCTTSSTSSSTSKGVLPQYYIRSQGTNAARRVAGTVGHVNLYDMDCLNGTMSLTLEGGRSFDSDEIAKCLFGDAICDCAFKVQGSRVSGRNERALLADYFYLPTDFDSTVRIEPRITSFNADFYFHFGLDEWVEGLYFWAQFPISYSKWDLNFCESVVETGTNNHDAGYFTPDELNRDNNLLANFSAYMNGSAPDSVTQDDITVNFEGLKCGKVCGTGDETKTTVPEIRFALGWNFLLDEDYHLGINLQASAPTGNVPDSAFLFDPQVGNGNHWGLGAGITGHFILWRSCDEEKHFGFYVDANFLHLFKDEQRRCFDLCGKPLSRYMLAAKMTDTVENLKGGATGPAAVAPSHQFANAYAPVANVTQTNVDVSVGVDADIVAWFNYTNCAWSWDIGYNFWGQSCHKIRTKCDCNTFQANTWVLKGDSHVYGFVASGDNEDDPVALSASMSKATINNGDNFGKAGATTAAAISDGRENQKVDNPQLAWNSGNIMLLTQPGGTDQINTSINPIFIKQSDINYARVKPLSHKLFSHLSYTWTERECWIPYLGVGFEVEWGTTDNCPDSDCCPTNCNTTRCDSSSNKTNGSCLKCALSQWGVWIKGGLSFN